MGSAAGPSARGTRRSYKSNGNGNGGASTENSTIKRGSKRRNGAISNGKQRSTLVRKSYLQSSDVGPNRKRPGPEPSQVEVGAAEVDPLVEAVTNSLEKLIRQNEGSGGSGEEGGIRRRIRRFSNEPQEEEVEDEIDDQALRAAAGKGKVDIVIGKEVGEEQGEGFSTEEEEEEEEEDGEDDDDDDDGSSTTSREEEDKYVQLRAEIARLQRQIQLGQVGQGQLSRSARHGGGSSGHGHEEGEQEDEDDEGTPLSVSPGSRGRSRRESSAM